MTLFEHIVVIIFLLSVCLTIIKALTIGSAFNFSLWFRFGKKYTQWYFDPKRNTFPLDISH